MPTQPNPDELFIGAGKLYFDRFDANGLATGLRFLGNASKFELTASVDKKDVWNYTKKSRTKLTQITVTQTHAVSIDLGEYSSENLALGLLGTAALYTQTGGTIVAEVVASSTQSTSTLPTIASLVPNSILQVANRIISAVALKAMVASTPTVLTLGVDYEIEDATEGLIRILSIANFPVSATSLAVDYTATVVTATASKKVITAGAMPQIMGRLMYIGDPVQGKARTVNAWRTHIEPSSAIALISDDLSNISLSGEILDDSQNHPTNPLYQVTTR